MHTHEDRKYGFQGRVAYMRGIDIRIRDLRMTVKQRLIDWGVVVTVSVVDMDFNNHPASWHLAKLFGYENYVDFCDALDEHPSLVVKLKLLAGENGYCIYKAMKAHESII